MSIFDKLKKNKNEITVSNDNLTQMNVNGSIIQASETVLYDTQIDIARRESIKLPIVEMASLGGAVSSLMPSLRTVTQTTTVNMSGLYRLANKSVDDTLKVAKNGNFWGAFKKADGGSKLAQLKEAGPLTGTSSATVPVDPATMMMAAALYSIEQKLVTIEEISKQIVSFLDNEKKANVEGGLQTLTNIMKEYKYNWDNDRYRDQKYGLILDVQKDSNENIIFYRKQIKDILDKSHAIVGKGTLLEINDSLQNNLKYYKTSLYSYTLATFLSTMFLGNFQEEHLYYIKEEITDYSMKYREVFAECSSYLEDNADKSIGKTALNGLGTIEGAIGNVIGKIPKIKEGSIDEWLIDKGNRHKESAKRMRQNVVEEFSVLSNPGTGMFIDKYEEMSKIYNHTTDICFDDTNVYLLVG